MSLFCLERGCFVVVVTSTHRCNNIWRAKSTQQNPTNQIKSNRELQKRLCLPLKMSSSQVLQGVLALPARSRQLFGSWRNRITSGGMHIQPYLSVASTSPQHKTNETNLSKQRKRSLRVASSAVRSRSINQYGQPVELQCIPPLERFTWHWDACENYVEDLDMVLMALVCLFLLFHLIRIVYAKNILLGWMPLMDTEASMKSLHTSTETRS